jgi:NADH-quinone oxidoreductase subunit G
MFFASMGGVCSATIPAHMPSITINGVRSDFRPGETILQVANRLKDQGNATEIPQYCYHDGLSVAASCRICLVEVWAPNPKTSALEPMMGGKLLPSCQQTCSDGMVVYADSPKAVANQKAVMEYLLINHPLDCPVCDQAGECFLQDYSYIYGRGVSRFEEEKVKNPKKDLGPHVYLYSDRCIMCTRCVRFTREVSGSGELMVQGRGNREEIDIFPGVAIANELSANVVDLCPVGALLDKDFLFAQRVWFLKSTPSIDGITASGDNIWIEHNEGKVYRFKPRTNMAVNTWWITDEVRYGWKFVHSPERLKMPMKRQFGTLVETDYTRAYEVAIEGVKKAVSAGQRSMMVVSPMLSCEEAYLLGTLARAMDPRAILAVGPVPVQGQDKTFKNNVTPPGPTMTLNPLADARKPFVMYAEKCPNSRGVMRVLQSLGGDVVDFAEGLKRLGHGTGASDVGAVILTGNYPSQWATNELTTSLGGKFTVLFDTLQSRLAEDVDVLIPGATWMEKAGTFENARNQIQAFEAAIPVIDGARCEGQSAVEMLRIVQAGGRAENIPAAESMPIFNSANVRRMMAEKSGLTVFVTGVSYPAMEAKQKPDMEMVEL